MRQHKRYFFPLAWISALVGVTLAMQAVLWWPNDVYAPMYGSGFDEPQVVLEDEVKIDGSITTVGVVKCNKLDHPISVTGNSKWRRIDNGGQLQIPDPPRSGGQLQPGCYDPRTFENKLPEGVTPGVWVHEGENSTYRGEERQTLWWTTESFRVVE